MPWTFFNSTHWIPPTCYTVSPSVHKCNIPCKELGTWTLAWSSLCISMRSDGVYAKAQSLMCLNPHEERWSARAAPSHALGSWHVMTPAVCRSPGGATMHTDNPGRAGDVLIMPRVGGYVDVSKWIRYAQMNNYGFAHRTSLSASLKRRGTSYFVIIIKHFHTSFQQATSFCT